MNKHKKWKSKINRTKDQIKFSLCFIQFLSAPVKSRNEFRNNFCDFASARSPCPRIWHNHETKHSEKNRFRESETYFRLPPIDSGKKKQSQHRLMRKSHSMLFGFPALRLSETFRETMNPVATKFVWICFVAASFVFRFAFQPSKEIVFGKVAWSA